MTVTPDSLATYLGDPEIDTARAQDFIDDATTLCTTVTNPLPSSADVVIKRVAGRAYVSVTSPRMSQMAAVGSPIGGMAGDLGGVYLTRTDIRDLRRASGSSSAFSIDQLPSTYAAPSDLPYWDQYTIPQATP